MRDDPQLDTKQIAACLLAHYDIHATAMTYLPIGYDLNAFVYKVDGNDGTPYFVKIRSGPIHEPGPRASRALIELGISAIVAPLRTRSSQLWAPLTGYEGYSVVVYPFVDGENAMVAGMSDHQWREFGATLRAVHTSELSQDIQRQLRHENFVLPSAALVRQLLILTDLVNFESPAASRLAAFWRDHADRIRRMLHRAETLGRSLKSRLWTMVPCHGDIHAANILVDTSDHIWLIDWDGPLMAPRERDLLFIIGSRIARVVKPREEALFFEGYGKVKIDPEALIYYRYQRIIEDLGEFGRSVFLDTSISEQMRDEEAHMAIRLFSADSDIDRAEIVAIT